MYNNEFIVREYLKKIILQPDTYVILVDRATEVL